MGRPGGAVRSGGDKSIMSADVDDCIFCRIIKGQIPAKFVLRDEEFVAFPDINPKAPVHLLVMPTAHIRSLNDVGSLEAGFGQRMLSFVARAAEVSGVSRSGYRVIINNGPDGGQEVDHLHLHILGGTLLGDLV